MIDSGASSNFMDRDFAVTHNLTLHSKRVPVRLMVVDGRDLAAGLITHEVHVTLTYDGYVKTLVLHVTRIASVSIILGKSWLDFHDPQFQWSTNKISFTGPSCSRHIAPLAPSVAAPLSLLSTSAAPVSAPVAPVAIYSISLRSWVWPNIEAVCLYPSFA